MPFLTASNGVETPTRYFDYPDEVAGLVFIGSYSAGKQLTVTEDQVLQLYETLQGRQKLFQALSRHEKFGRYNPHAVEIEAMLRKEACKPPILCE